MRTSTLLLTCLLLSIPLAAQQTPSDTSSIRARYADDLAELERMKEKFRQQQQRKLRERERGGELPGTWSVPEQSVPAADVATPIVGRPSDTSQLRANVQTGLYAPAPQSPEARRAWENRVQTGLPQQEQVSAEEAARLDAEYERQLREVEELRAKLQEARGAQPAAASERTPQRTTTRQKELTAKGPAAALDVTFIPNTSYPNAQGYDALDVLAERVRNAATVVEIRVHTSRELDVRAAQFLSEERATTIRKYLREAGIAAENFRVVGYGNHESAAGERVEIIAQ